MKYYQQRETSIKIKLLSIKTLSILISSQLILVFIGHNFVSIDVNELTLMKVHLNQ